jgi:hypothetical protein
VGQPDETAVATKGAFVDVDIRGEMEAAAAELESKGEQFEGDSAEEGTPASDETETGKDDEQVDEVETESDDKKDEVDASKDAGNDADDASKADADPATKGDTSKATSKQTQKAPLEKDELPAKGSIPVDRVRKILENARTKARAEVETELAWAKELPKDDAVEAVRVWQYAEQNPVAFAKEILSRLQNHPQYRDEVAQIFEKPAAKEPAPKEEPAEKEHPKPQPDVLLEDGRLLYSDAQMGKLLEWQSSQVESRLTKRLKPFEEARKQQDFNREVEEHAAAVITEVKTWAGMSDPENQKAVAEAMRTRKLSVDAAYRAVVLPKITDTSAIEKRVRAQVLAELKQKTRASTRNPQRTESAPASTKGMSIRQILEATADEIGLDDE